MTRDERPARRLLRSFLAHVLLVGWLPACAVTPLPPAEQLRRSKCGACHPAPQPGTRSRAALQRVLDAHRERVPLRDDQRRTLLEHLSGPRPRGP